MRKKVSKKDAGDFEKNKWFDAENNLRDPKRLYEFILELFETRDKLSKQKLFKRFGGEQEFRKHITATALRFKEMDESKVTAHRLIAYVYFRLQFLLRESN